MPSLDQSHEQSGDLAVLWIESEPNIRAFVAATVWDVHHAEDVLQDVASVAARNFSSYDASRPFLPWCLGIARLKIMEYLRSHSRDRMVMSDATLLALESATLDLAEDYLTARRAALQQCVRKLKGRQRRVIELRYLVELPLDEVADQLATTSSTVTVTLHRARTALRECIKRTISAETPSP